MTTVPKRRYGEVNSGSSDKVHGIAERGSCRQTRDPPMCACRSREPSKDDGLHTADSDPDGNESGSESSLGYRWIEPAKRCRICIDLLPGVADSRLDLRRALTVRRARALRFPSTSYS